MTTNAQLWLFHPQHPIIKHTAQDIWSLQSRHGVKRNVQYDSLCSFSGHTDIFSKFVIMLCQEFENRDNEQLSLSCCRSVFWESLASIVQMCNTKEKQLSEEVDNKADSTQTGFLCDCSMDKTWSKLHYIRISLFLSISFMLVSYCTTCSSDPPTVCTFALLHPSSFSGIFL